MLRMLNRSLLVWSLSTCWLGCTHATAEATEESRGPFRDSDLRTAVVLRDKSLSGIAYELTRSLASDIGARPAGSQAERDAVKWALARLRELGFEQIRLQQVSVPHWERGDAHVEILNPSRRDLAAVSLGGSVGTPQFGIKASVVRVADIDVLRSLPEHAARGRVVFIDTKMQRSRDRDGYLAAVPSRLSGASIAAAKGAVAVVIRSVGTSTGPVVHTGMVAYDQSEPRIPALALSNADADVLEELLAKQPTVELFIRSSAADRGIKKSANVIVDIPGTNRGDELVLVGAHLDSWDLGQGAHDDAAGVAIVMAALSEILRLKLQPSRTIRLVLFANEEFGLSGAHAYAKATLEVAPRHVAAIEADSGADRAVRLESNVPLHARPAVMAIHTVLQPLGIELGGNTTEGAPDLGPLRARNVPVFSIDQDRTRYFDFHHSAADTIDKIDPSQIAQATAAYAATIWLLAQYPGYWDRQ